MNYEKYVINGKEYNISPAVELCKRNKWEGTIKYLTQVLGVDPNTAIRIRAEIISDLKKGEVAAEKTVSNNKLITISDLKKGEVAAEKTVSNDKLINELEDLYAFSYKGSKLDISALFVHVRENNTEAAVAYLTERGIEKNDANQICAEVKELLKEDVSFSNDNNYVKERYSFLGEAVYSIKGNRGRHLDVYEDFAVITVSATVGAVITGNVFDGKKIIFYSDCIGIQFKEPGVAIGYLQLETASSTMNNNSSSFFNENTFTFDDKNFREVFEAYKFIFNRMIEIKTR